ncbi:cadherin-like domain-containing protein [Shewanella corallii]|uniref:Cadherin-like domain-containing protein n=1 Tax=Shewanella corallii TaxID=560080 RepID=A0ABT0N822_9GAMM|nr:cadherin-like domain-containing protein [Shewanella corallii]MCL2914603.1 cadherin-like domain-containing protein [Shewanella corallii]
MLLKALNHKPVAGVLLACSVGLLAGCDDDDTPQVLPPPEVNLPPVAHNDSLTAVVRKTQTIDVLANDTDADGDELILSHAGIKQGAGAVLIVDNQLQFQGDYPGMAVVEYQIHDGKGANATATVSINLSADADTRYFVGTQTCLNCHEDKASFLETGHNYKLSRIENGLAPSFPFTSLEGSVEMLHGAENSAGTPDSWDDVSYVIGGYYRTAMFIDKNGYIVSGDGVRVAIPEHGEDFGIEHILPYAPGDGPDSHMFTCGSCHTTGWRDYTADSVRSPYKQDNMPGFTGSFSYTGIQCEACHGAGSKHIQTGMAEDITRVAEGRLTADLLQDDMAYGQPMACAECHSKKTNRSYPGFVSEHNQDFGGDSLGGRTIPYDIGGRVAADAMLGLDANTGEPMGKKRGMACHTCHDPHQSKINDDQPGHEMAMVKECRDCHKQQGFTEYLDIHGEVARCEDCHMPNDKHFFRINLDYASDSKHNFSEDGKYVQPWNTAKDSCSQCHEHYDSQADIIERMHN